MRAKAPGLPLRFLAPAIVLGAVICAAFGLLAAPRAQLPSWAELRSASIQADLDGDAAGDMLYLANGRLEVRGSDGMRYLSPRSWIVADAFVHDYDGDGAGEIALNVWKRGSFGTSKPFWVEHDTAARTQHVFVMRYGHGDLAPVWMSSDLGEDAHRVWFDDGGGLHLAGPDETEEVCRWEHWGFTLAEDDGDGLAQAGDPVAGDGVADDAGGAVDAVEFAAVGDNIMHLSLCEQAHDERVDSYDFAPVYEHVADRIASCDLAAVCQETALVHDRADIGGYPDFGTPEEAGDALAQAGFDIVASATNHVLDRGVDGVRDTLAFWAGRHPDVVVLGLHETAEDAAQTDVVECKGMRFALFDATYGLNGRALPAGQEWRIDTFDDLDAIAARVAQAEGEADLSICFLHVGDEYSGDPSDEQRQAVERLVDAGADLVICSHPHVVQPVERIRTNAGAEAVVFWSLGNFASHQTDVRTVLGGAAFATFARDAEGRAVVASYALEPTVCHFNEDGTAVYFLDDYSDELAGSHYLSTADAPLSLAALNSWWVNATGRNATGL